MTQATEPTVAEMVAALEAELRGGDYADGLITFEHPKWADIEPLDHRSAEGERFFATRLAMKIEPYHSLEHLKDHPQHTQSWNAVIHEVISVWQDDRTDAYVAAVEQAARKAWERRNG